MKKFDVVVIGTGSAGATVALKCREASWSVAIIDSLPLGGTCALRGCDPKKVLVGAAEVLDWSKRMSSKGVKGKIAIDWPSLIRFKKTFTNPVPGRNEAGYSKAGIPVFKGRAHFKNPNTLEIGKDILEAKNIVIAAGAKPMDLPIKGAKLLLTSDQFLELTNLPQRIIFVGGGFISFEFAHIAARAGAKATILHRDNSPLNMFDQDLVAKLLEATKAAGIEVRLKKEVKGVEKSGAGFAVLAAGGETFEGDIAVHGAGRVPDIDDLNLEKAGIERQGRGIKLNEYLQSVSNPAIYAVGDAASQGPPLTPVAGYDGEIVATNLIEGNHATPDYKGTASVVFTVPPLAAVGLSQEEAGQKNLHFRVNFQDTTSWYSSRRTAEKHTGFKVLVEEKTERILGAHILGAHAEEIINIFALAIKKGLKASDLKEALYAYPTLASNIPYMV